MMNADVFVYFDNVQYTRRDWRNRNYIINKSGDKQLLSIPIHSKGNYIQEIKDVKIHYQQNKWIKQHLWLIKETYRKTPYFEDIFFLLSKYLNKNYAHLSNLCIDLNIAFAEYLSLDCQIIKSSELSYDSSFNNASEHLLNICKALNATDYLSGPASKAYLDVLIFNENDISVKFHEYTHPIYDQNSATFISFLSIVDLLFRYGKKSKDILFQKMY